MPARQRLRESVEPLAADLPLATDLPLAKAGASSSGWPVKT